MPVVTPDQITTNFVFAKMTPDSKFYLAVILILMAGNNPVYGTLLTGSN